MDYEPGDEYPCDACGGVHEVERARDLRVAGSGKRLDGAPYVRCPAAGVVSLTDEDAAGTADDWP